MIKFKKYQYRSLWYKKIYYYMQAGQSLPDAVAVSGDDIEIAALQRELETGKRMSQICKDDFNDVFSFVEIALISVAEKTGKMKDNFLSLSSLLKAQYIQKQKLIAAAIYPVIVLVLATGLLVMILMIIVPKIGPLFSDIKDLPISTSILLAASEHVRRMWWIHILLIVGLVIFHHCLRRYSLYRNVLIHTCRKFFFHMPYIRDVYMLWYIEKWMQVVCVCLQAHTSLHESLSLAGESTGNKFIRQEFYKVEQSVEGGNTCAESLRLMDKRVYRRLRDWESIIRSGEATGTLLDVFLVCHEHTKSELDGAFDKAQKIIEPALIVVVGLMVLCICLSIILPMYQLTQSISN